MKIKITHKPEGVTRIDAGFTLYFHAGKQEVYCDRQGCHYQKSLADFLQSTRRCYSNGSLYGKQGSE